MAKILEDRTGKIFLERDSRRDGPLYSLYRQKTGISPTVENYSVTRKPLRRKALRGIAKLSSKNLCTRSCAPKKLLLNAPPSPQDDAYHDAVVAELVDAQR
ncbi:hypothetical protein [Allorhizobium borbori]|uniref:hypothetical protein n=1 Tax=Allorhizobium borbori TaxID=485907 RepID=UPI00161B76D3|nr:hypothetical protein [Allorhizobium borbori]